MKIKVIVTSTIAIWDQRWGPHAECIPRKLIFMLSPYLRETGFPGTLRDTFNGNRKKHEINALGLF